MRVASIYIIAQLVAFQISRRPALTQYAAL